MITIKDIEKELMQTNKTRVVLRSRLKNAPKGKLRGIRRGEKYYYYQVLKQPIRGVKRSHSSASCHPVKSGEADSKDPSEMNASDPYRMIPVRQNRSRDANEKEAIGDTAQGPGNANATQCEPEKIDKAKRKKPASYKQIYIPKNKEDLAYNLARKRYYEHLDSILKNNQLAMTRFIKEYVEDSLHAAYEKLGPATKALLGQLDLTEDEDDAAWAASPFEGNPFPIERKFHTLDGRIVRSKSEMDIADRLLHHHVANRYEDLMWVNGKMYYPDFKCRNVRTHQEIPWEHLGAMDDDDYCAVNLPKLANYMRDGYIPGRNMIVTFETFQCPLDNRVIDNMIEHYLL